MEGRTISHYRVLEKLGGGGMGVVYKAQDTKLDRFVALKFLPPELTRDDDARERFIREAQAASALDHPNICTIHEIDATPEGQQFIAMAYYEGETLKKRIARGPLPVDDALDIAVQVAQGLAEAHAAGIVHRDIKPANVMLTKSGLVKIVDFGIAKLLGVTGPTQTGTTLGTVSYMSPEQVKGVDADQRSDLWALGVMLYEMLTGQLPFKGEHPLVLISAIQNELPRPLGRLRQEIPDEVERIVTRALEKKRDARYQSAAEFLKDLVECQSARTTPVAEVTSLSRAVRQPRVAVSAIVAVLAIAGGAMWAWNRAADARWAREEAIPEIIRLVEQDNYPEAFELAREAGRYVPNDPILADLAAEFSVSLSVTTAPPGADVYLRAYGSTDSDWEYLGLSPIDDITLPRDTFRWRLEKDGFETVEIATPSRTESLSVTLDETGARPPGMVFVPGGNFDVRLTGFAIGERVDLQSFLIDKYEVTNKEYKEFVDGGGYDRENYWEGLDFVKDGRQLSRETAMAEFVDSTDRPGPATWELGDYLEGQDDHPVTGISWYEAVAYARFRGKTLPTVYHWSRAAFPARELVDPLAPSIVPLSNFGGNGPDAVGHHQGIGPYGTYDMAGNLREWTWNLSAERRWVLGGAWSDPEYMFSIPNYLPPFDRSPLNGFRCMQTVGEEPASPTLRQPIELSSRNYEDAEAVSDDVFEAYRRQFSYVESALNVIEETLETSEDWVRQKVTFDTGYANERMAAYLFIPRNVDPPYQAVVLSTGVGPYLAERSSEDLQPRNLDFIVRGGRVLVQPIFKGSYERWDSFLALPGEEYMRTFRDRMIEWRQDLGRTLDYLESREDIDATRVAYFGASFGASAFLPLLALEERLKVAVFRSGGLPYRAYPPMADAINYVSRITMPVLMLNGEFDYLFSVETYQKPPFERLGAPVEDKRYRTFDAGHVPLPRNQVLRETLDWLDKYLGPVS